MLADLVILVGNLGTMIDKFTMMVCDLWIRPPNNIPYCGTHHHKVQPHLDKHGCGRCREPWHEAQCDLQETEWDVALRPNGGGSELQDDEEAECYLENNNLVAIRIQLGDLSLQSSTTQYRGQQLTTKSAATQYNNLI
jgi:hypothetical protein